MLVVININSLMRRRLCGKLHGGRSQLLFALQQSSIDSKLFVENRDLCLPHLRSTPPLGGSTSEYCHNVGYEKTRMVWLPGGEKNLKICLFVSSECTNVSDKRTDGQTPHDGIGRAYA